ncbi:MBL fold metallo-hydrolase [Synechococcus sp. EJ6-Ellesmere]|uniref:MBL fold metallo-hydrolase n=1 Tax=Synechococcus sp. EJ6-Ellesmere TaxID=2823734 RepID=UPI0020CE0769|nr:MBL fold metallo-hydrolase [Synechococcus sp. EJ6-Ellesmere]MCP9823990.1 MBL fold metallo-hydrolase [Synechococcus sp. EJ6-Ellesmere]
MARVAERLAANVDGPFYVDASCIDCGTCWQFDPAHFAPTGRTSHVRAQPAGEEETRAALLALQACPVAAIGTTRELLAQTPADGFPALVTSVPRGEVHYCGWASRKSFGASSWLITRRRADGSADNVLIDSPRWSAPLARRIEALGGVGRILLSHRDDVADHQAWAQRFGAERWIHSADAAAAPQAEHRFEGTERLRLDDDLLVIPVPGHTAGCVAVLFADQVLFSGDHLWWGVDPPGVVASRRVCWWNWDEQRRSVERLLDLDVRWLLPGHGRWHAFAPGEWRRQLEATLARVREGQGGEL